MSILNHVGMIKLEGRLVSKQSEFVMTSMMRYWTFFNNFQILFYSIIDRWPSIVCYISNGYIIMVCWWWASTNPIEKHGGYKFPCSNSRFDGPFWLFFYRFGRWRDVGGMWFELHQLEWDGKVQKRIGVVMWSSRWRCWDNLKEELGSSEKFDKKIAKIQSSSSSSPTPLFYSPNPPLHHLHLILHHKATFTYHPLWFVNHRHCWRAKTRVPILQQPSLATSNPFKSLHITHFNYNIQRQLDA